MGVGLHFLVENFGEDSVGKGFEIGSWDGIARWNGIAREDADSRMASAIGVVVDLIAETSLHEASPSLLETAAYFVGVDEISLLESVASVVEADETDILGIVLEIALRSRTDSMTGRFWLDNSTEGVLQ